MASSELEKLLDESKKLVSHIDTGGVPTIQRSIPQLAAFASRLVSSHQHGLDPSTESHAQMFFASNGMDITRNQRILRAINLTKSYEPLEHIHELDVDKFLEHQHQMLVNTAIAESCSLVCILVLCVCVCAFIYVCILISH
jgi:hypothetical protein